MASNLNCALFVTFAMMLNCIYCSGTVDKEYELNYKEIVSLNASCYPSDSCSISRSMPDDNLLHKTCQCQFSCVTYNTCCIDSPNIHSARSVHSTGNVLDVSCLNLGGEEPYHVFAVNKCKKDWNGNLELRTLCETQNIANLKDPIAVLPVTSTNSSITYWNYFCALCNGVSENELQFWNVKITGTDTDDTDFEQLFYHEEYKKWGFMTPNNNFTFVTIAFDSGSLYDKIHYCHPNLISSCSPTWQDNVVERKCSAYMGMLYGDLYDSLRNVTLHDMRFRNVHCAICNFALYDSENLCSLPVYPTFDIRFGGEPTLSFALLLDINLADGDRVGKVRRCQRGELYDSFSKKCRNLVCLKPGYTVKNGKCAQS